jgi:hypothetical protein
MYFSNPEKMDKLGQTKVIIPPGPRILRAFVQMGD